MNATFNEMKINLENYFNSKAIGDIDYITSGKFENVGLSGMMIVPGSMEYLSESNTIYKNLFLFSDKDSGRCDNIICAGQEILGDFGKHNKIYVLGMSEWINVNDVIYVTYKDGITEMSQLSVPQGAWYDLIMKSRERPLLFNTEYLYLERGRSFLAFLLSRRNEKNVNKIGMYVSECSLEYTGEIKSICLPDNEFLNIFAITLL